MAPLSMRASTVRFSTAAVSGFEERKNKKRAGNVHKSRYSYYVDYNQHTHLYGLSTRRECVVINGFDSPGITLADPCTGLSKYIWQRATTN